MCDKISIAGLAIDVVCITMDGFRHCYMKNIKFITTVQEHLGSLSSRAGGCHQLPEPPCYLLWQSLGLAGDSYEASRLGGLALVFLPHVV